MKADYLTFRRATSTSVLGLVIQLILGLILLIYAVRAHDHAAMSGSFVVLLGVASWAILAVWFDQYRRERVEAMEAESFAASDAAASSVFEEGVGELRLAAKRLATFNRFIVPVMSVLIACALIAIGYWRLGEGYKQVDPDQFSASAYPLLAMVLGLTLAFVGFILGRFVSGMSTQKAWRPLSAGAGYAVAAALIGASIAVGHFVNYMGSDSMLRWLNALIPAATIALGVESLVVFIWDLYRPRRAGELPRAAFDSRVLGAVAAPDLVAQSVAEAIDYWFGSARASSWISELLQRWVYWLVLTGLLTMWLLSGLVVIQSNQRAMILRFGRIVNADAGPGLHLKAPWPIGSVVRHDATSVRVLHAGAPAPPKEATTVLWSGDHHPGVEMANFHLLVQPSPIFTDLEASARPAESSDLSILVAEVPIRYTVGDLRQFVELAESGTYDQTGRLVEPGQLEIMLDQLARREVLLQFSSMNVDEVLDTKRSQLSQIMSARIADAFRFEPLGEQAAPNAIDVGFVGVIGIHPPEINVATRFEQVVEAQQRYIALLEDATAEAEAELIKVAGDAPTARRIVEELDRLDAMSETESEAAVAQRVRIDGLVDRAGGAAAAIIHEASAQRWALHMGARARALRYQGQLASYRAAPEVYVASLWFDALKELMSNARVYIIGAGLDPYIVYDLKDQVSSIGQFLDARDEESDN